MKLVNFKIKRKTLMGESRFIKGEEQKALATGRMLNAMADRAAFEAHMSKVTNRSVTKHEGAVPCRFTDHQVRRIRRNYSRNTPVYSSEPSYTLYESLREHRRTVVRPAARAAHIALAYIKGRALKSVEGKKDSGDFDAGIRANIARDVNTFGPDRPGEDAVNIKDIKHWMDGGKTVYEEDEIAAAEGDGTSSKLVSDMDVAV